VRIGILLIIIGVGLALYSHSLPVYSNASHFSAEVAAIGNTDATQHYYIIQDKYITNKYRLLDYSICIFLLGILRCVIMSIGLRNLKSPRKTITIVATGIVAVGLSLVSYYTDSIVTVVRDLSPPWSSHELPSYESYKKTFFFLIGWLALHALVLRKDFHPSRRFSSLSLDYMAIGLLSSTLLAGGFVIITLVGGQPIYALSALLWFYFHLSLLVGKQSSRRME
jgi:hypothetical protein|tara:strand:- start:514 stop:1185 length:672 start_codon:yes stop_codon:yes gene_type:complete